MAGRDVTSTITLGEKLLAVGLLLASIAGTAYVSLYRLSAAEARVEVLSNSIELKADKTELADKAAKIDGQLSSIQSGLGLVQLDVAKMCVASLGIEKCSTAGRGR